MIREGVVVIVLQHWQYYRNREAIFYLSVWDGRKSTGLRVGRSRDLFAVQPWASPFIFLSFRFIIYKNIPHLLRLFGGSKKK